MTLYKVLSSSLRSCHGGDYQWTPGKWTPKRKPALCESGWHLCDGESQLLGWLGEAIWIAEARGDVVRADDKIVVESARIVEQAPWSDREARLFACDCAAHVLHIYERDSDDPAPRIAIEIARARAIGETTDEELAASAANAANATAATAAYAYAATAAYAAYAYASDAAAYAAAYDATTATAAYAADAYSADAYSAYAYASRDAARDAARAAERKWQSRRLRWYLDGCPLPVPADARMDCDGGDDVKRYDPNGGHTGPAMLPHDEGDWVRYDDHAAEVARLKEEQDCAVKEAWGAVQSESLRADTACEDVTRLEAERDRYKQALVAARNELGVPGPDYPAPVANAAGIIAGALDEVTT